MALVGISMHMSMKVIPYLITVDKTYHGRAWRKGHVDQMQSLEQLGCALTESVNGAKAR